MPPFPQARVRPTSGPPLGFGWVDDQELSTILITEGTPPLDDDDVVIDIDTVEAAGVSVGDQVRINTPAGAGSYELTGVVSFGETNALSGATLTAFSFADGHFFDPQIPRYRLKAAGTLKDICGVSSMPSTKEMGSGRSDKWSAT